jgi:hypothetical protein
MGLQTNDLVAAGITSWNGLPPNAIQPMVHTGRRLANAEKQAEMKNEDIQSVAPVMRRQIREPRDAIRYFSLHGCLS